MYYDQVAQVKVPRWSSGRVVLLGDACQGVDRRLGTAPAGRPLAIVTAVPAPAGQPSR